MSEQSLLELIKQLQTEFSGMNCTLMEVCGTHTNAIRKAGIHRLLPPGVRLLSGPGCPVCVTGSNYIEQAVNLSKEPGTIVATFGDLLKVPGNSETLAESRAGGGRVRIVYSPLDAVELAKNNPRDRVVFLGVGFETTAPVIALAIQTAKQEKVRNFSVLPALKILRPALEALLQDPGLSLDGLVAPGHLSVVIGAAAFKFLPEKYHLPTVITGFGIGEIWLGLAALLKQIQRAEAKLENMYPRAVAAGGNTAARKLIGEVFQVEDAEWRGLGLVKKSGFGPAGEYQEYDARVRFHLPAVPSKEPPGCLCGMVLLGKKAPEACPLFDTQCRPDHPVGPCMVSSEGACAAHFYYRDRGGI
ncbi:MAG: hydrogenase formation protein HypD [Bacillota bacterium]